MKTPRGRSWRTLGAGGMILMIIGCMLMARDLFAVGPAASSPLPGALAFVFGSVLTQVALRRKAGVQQAAVRPGMRPADLRVGRAGWIAAGFLAVMVAWQFLASIR